MDEPVVIVCGLGRCGSTMAMRMLHRGGLDVITDEAVPIAYETKITLELPGNWEWLLDCGGRAVKVLDPHRHQLPPWLPYRFVWMRRDFRQQARSSKRFGKLMNEAQAAEAHLRGQPAPTPIAIPRLSALIERLKHESRAALELLAMYPYGQLTVIDFEDVLREPARAAVVLARAVGRDDLDLEAMVAQVIERSATARRLPLELEMIREGGG
jgi:hypothetical protein